MPAIAIGRRSRRLRLSTAAALCVLPCAVAACAALGLRPGARLEATAALVGEVKAFEAGLGIAATDALRRTSADGPPLSMVWIWLQKTGTLAIRTPIDVRFAIGFAQETEQLKLEQVYRVDGYSVYYRQGNEFADRRALATFSFADEAAVRQVKIVIHEDLHGDENFDLPWEVEEAVVTPLASLATVEFFRSKGDVANLERALESLEQERQFSRELNRFLEQAEAILRVEEPEKAKQKILALLPSFPKYERQFRSQLQGQHAPAALEAKLSHDAAYYRLHDRIVELAGRAGGLTKLLRELQKLPKDATVGLLEAYLDSLAASYGARAES